MASTRNRNTPINYAQEQRQFREAKDYALYEHSFCGSAYDTRLPGNGLNPAQIPGNQLSSNASDIESFLFGINSTNLVKPADPLTPELKYLPSANVFDKGPVLMPEPLVVPKGQRPFPLP
jgi:hypothetical protein